LLTDVVAVDLAVVDTDVVVDLARDAALEETVTTVEDAVESLAREDTVEDAALVEEETVTTAATLA